MSLDALVKDEGKTPVLCLPHQCEFLSDKWLQRAREFLEQAIAKPTRKLPAFSLTERFVQAPPHLGCTDNQALWSVKFDGETLLVDREPAPRPDVHVEGIYQAGLFMAQVVGAQVPGSMAEAFSEMKHLFGTSALTRTGRFNDPVVANIVAQLHDHMARMHLAGGAVGHREAQLRHGELASHQLLLVLSE